MPEPPNVVTDILPAYKFRTSRVGGVSMIRLLGYWPWNSPSLFKLTSLAKGVSRKNFLFCSCTGLNPWLWSAPQIQGPENGGASDVAYRGNGMGGRVFGGPGGL